MGDWVYYVTYLTFNDITHWIKKTDQIHKTERLREMIQRQLSSRSISIAKYLINQEERFFNAIVVGVYGGAPKWYPIDIEASPVLGEVELDDSSRDSIGLLMLEGNEGLFAIDGQHRVEAIKQALKTKPELGTDEISVIFVAHKTDEKGQTRTRRLFSTLNRYAKPVSKGEIVALDEDDAFAIITRRLVEDFYLMKGFVHFGKTAPLPPNDRKNLTTILALYDISQVIYVPILDNKQRQQMKKLKILRPSDEVLDNILEEQKNYWAILKDYFPEYKRLFQSEPNENVAGEYRTSEGGHLMFRPAGQQAFARSVRIMMDRGMEMKDAVAQLSSVSMRLNAPPWRNILWDPNRKKINNNVSPLLTESVLLHCVDQEPRSQKYNLLAEYRKMTGDDNARIECGKL
jgi:DNA sulfur modification protein DndB